MSHPVGLCARSPQRSFHKDRTSGATNEGFERDGHANGWIAIDIVVLIHQATIAARTADLHWKDPVHRWRYPPGRAASPLLYG